MPKIPYPGGKGRLARQIISFLPKEGRTYVEPFAGRGNLFWEAVEQGLRYRRWWLNDIATIPFFRAIQREGQTLKVPTRCRAEYERQRMASTSGDPVAILLEPYLTFSGGGYFGAGCGGDGKSNNAVSSAGYEKTLRKCHAMLHEVKPRLSSLDWQDMGLEKLTEDDVVVLDPPYPNSNVRGSYSDTINYEALVDLLCRAKFRWVLCGYPHPVLCRLGQPFWARDLQFVLPIREDEPRTECLWANFTPDIDKSRRVLPPSVKGQIRSIADAASLPFRALDTKIDDGLDVVAKDFTALIPYLLEMHRRLSAPGKRNDLRKGAPADLTWIDWVESKRHKLGRSLRTIQYMLQGKTDASQQRQLLAGARANLAQGLRQEPDSLIPESVMEIATEMARLVLEMRSNGRNTPTNKRKLEKLAVRFLRLAGQKKPASVTALGGETKESGYTM